MTASNVAFIDKQPVVDAHAAFWLPHGAPLVGNVAALAPHKGQRHSGRRGGPRRSRASRRAVPHRRRGRTARTARAADQDLGLERHVFLAGFRPDALGLMKSFDVFAMSSVTEGLGSAMLEAMACGARRSSPPAPAASPRRWRKAKPAWLVAPT